MVLGYGLRDLKAHMNEIIKLTTTGYRYKKKNVKNEGGLGLFFSFFCHFAFLNLTMITTTI